MKNFEQQLLILTENFKQGAAGSTLKEYVLSEANSDPNFYRWLFGADLEQDFDTSLTDEQKSEFQSFLNSLS